MRRSGVECGGNASSGVSPGLNAVDTGLKAGMALQGVVEQGLESAYLPALAQLGLKGMACLPVSKQLDPVLGIDCHLMVPGGPLPNPYIGLLINPRTVMSEKVCKILLRPSPQAWGTPSLREICDVDFCRFT